MKTKQLLIISNGVDQAVKFSKDRGWQRSAWKYIGKADHLSRYKEGTLILVEDYEQRRDIARIQSIIESDKFLIIDESSETAKTKRELALLSVAHSALNSILTQFSLGPAIQAPALKAKKALCDTILGWKYKGKYCNDIVNTKWIKGKLDKWDRELIGLDSSWSISILINVSLQACVDCFEQLDDEEKENSLDSVFEPLQEISDFLDKKGTQLATYNYTDYLMCTLYDLIGFEV